MLSNRTDRGLGLVSEEALKRTVDTESPVAGLTNLVMQVILVISSFSNHLRDERVSSARGGTISQDLADATGIFRIGMKTRHTGDANRDIEAGSSEADQKDVERKEKYASDG